MRAGGCAVQQALTPEAAAVVKQAVALAKRRGHAQVTPLHVANTMLSASASGAGLLRAACQQLSHSHPLQCKALELCFNVALNRLPAASPSGPLLGGGHTQWPSISNALVAAFKRAQAHQRRGSVENNQQQNNLLTVKIELEQLVISILDDPSVSRVMREAGFSSTQVKTNVEKVVSLELCSPSPSIIDQVVKEDSVVLSLQPLSTPTSTGKEPVKNDDVSIVMESLLCRRKRKSVVIVGESISNVESTVKELMDRVDRKEVPEELREVKFISIPPLYSFCNLQRDSMEQKMRELAVLVKSLAARGVVLYLGDLNWISEYRVSSLEKERNYYCSVEHMIMEIGRLVGSCGIDNGSRFWVMGIATFQTYMRCRSGYHSLENVWRLHPVTVPANSLSLSLISHQRDEDEHTDAGNRKVEIGFSTLQLMTKNHEEVKLDCCADCSSRFEAESQKNLLTRNNFDTNEPTSSSLPPWLKDESNSGRLYNNDQIDHDSTIFELSKKWNSYSSSSHKQRPRSSLERTLTLSNSASPSSSTSCFSFDQQNPNNYPQKTPFSSNINPNSIPSSPSSAETTTYTRNNYSQKLFKEFNSQNLNTLCNALEKKVPWQRDIIPDIAATILQSRSGMLRRKDKKIVKEDTWLFFLGPDTRAKDVISRNLAKVVFGSRANFVSIGMQMMSSLFSPNNSSSEEYCGNKRGRSDEEGRMLTTSHMERLSQAVSLNPHRVFFLEDFDGLDYPSQMGIKRAIERGRIRGGSGDQEVGFEDAIVILSCERFSSRSRACSPSSKQKTVNGDGEEGASAPRAVPLDLNMSFDDCDSVENQSVDDLGVLELVDRCVVFK